MVATQSNLPWQFIPAMQPAPAEGIYFRRQSVAYYDKLPIGQLPMYGACWFDMDTDTQAGSMCHAVIEMDANRRFYLTEMWHGRTDLTSAIQALFQLQAGLHQVELWKEREPQRHKTYGPKRWFCMQSQYESGVGKRINLKRVRLNERVENYRDRFRINVGPYTQALTLPEMARTLQADLVTQNLLLPRNVPWLAQLETELYTWPAHGTASRIAALGLLCSARDLIHPGRGTSEPNRRPPGTTWMSD